MGCRVDNTVSKSMANYSYTGSVRDLLEVEISAEGTVGLQLKKKRLSTGLQTLAVSGLLKDSFGRTPAAAADHGLRAGARRARV